MSRGEAPLIVIVPSFGTISPQSMRRSDDLAGTVGTNEAKHFTVRNGQVDTLKGVHIAVMFVDILNANHGITTSTGIPGLRISSPFFTLIRTLYTKFERSVLVIL